MPPLPPFIKAAIRLTSLMSPHPTPYSFSSTKAPSTSAPYPTPSSTRPAAAATRCGTVGHSCTRKTSGCAGLVPSAVQLVLKQTPLSPAPPRCLLARLTTKVNITRLPTQEGSDMFTCRLFRARVRVHAKCGVKKSERAHARLLGSFLLPPPHHHHPSPPVPFLKCEAFVGGGSGRWDSGRGTTNSSSSVSGYCSLLWRAPVYIDLPAAWQDRIPFFAAFQTQMFRHSLLFLLTTDNLWRKSVPYILKNRFHLILHPSPRLPPFDWEEQNWTSWTNNNLWTSNPRWI